MQAVVYVGHGSRSAKGNQQFISFIRKTIDEINIPIQEISFLESSTPTVEEAITTCVQKGATSICLMPVLLLTGIHAKYDIPREMEQAKKMYPSIRFSYGDTLGINSLTTRILAEKLMEQNFNIQEKNVILLVGHGSRLAETATQFNKLNELLKSELNYEHVFSCFLKSNEPTFSEELKRLLAQEYDKIFILPYLLFSGGFTEGMKKMVSEAQCTPASTKIIHCEPLGFHSKLGSLIVKRVDEALRKQLICN